MRKSDLELAPREPLLVHGGDQPSAGEERGARVVTVPDPEDVQWH